MDLRNHCDKICTGCQHIVTGCKWDPTDSSVLPFALAGSFGWRYCGNGCLVESGRYFVDVVQCEEGKYQAETERKAKQMNSLKTKNTFRIYF